MEAAKHIAEKTEQLSINPRAKTTTKTATTQLFLHWEYHPTDIARQKIQQVYKETAGPVFEKMLDVDKVTIAYSNPRNLRRCLTKTQLEEPTGDRVSLLVEQLRQKTEASP